MDHHCDDGAASPHEPNQFESVHRDVDVQSINFIGNILGIQLSQY